MGFWKSKPRLINFSTAEEPGPPMERNCLLLDQLRADTQDLPAKVEALREQHLPKTAEIALKFAPCGRTLSMSWSCGDPDIEFRAMAWTSRGLNIVRAMDRMRLTMAKEVGCPWLELTISSAGEAWVDFDHYPETVKEPWTDLHATALVSELVVVPRWDSTLIPAWMKVRLAAEGYWDIDHDRAAWTDTFDPTARPVPQAEAEAAYADATPVSHILFGPNGAPDGLRRPLN